MDKSTRRLIIIIIVFLIIDVLILLYTINQKPDYNKKLYDEIYSEYNKIFEDDNSTEQTYDNQQNKSQKKDIIHIEQGIFGEEYKVIGKIGISKINLYSPIIYETTDELMKIGPTKLCGPALNEIGNVCIIGHNYRNDQFFSNLSNLQINDEIIIINNLYESLNYKVYDKYQVLEDDVSCLSQETNGKKELTLITCTKNKKKRLIVKCREIE